MADEVDCAACGGTGSFVTASDGRKKGWGKDKEIHTCQECGGLGKVRR